MQNLNKDVYSGMRLDVKCNSVANMNNMEIQKLVSSTQSYICRNPKKSRRLRSSFTTEQLNYLESEFKKFPYIGNVNRQELARNLNLPERAIKIWFQNRRMKEKKESNKEDDIINQCMSLKMTNQLNNVQSANDEINISTPLQIGSNEAKYVAITSSITADTPIHCIVKDSREQEISTTTETIENMDTGKTNHEELLLFNERKMGNQKSIEVKHLNTGNAFIEQDNRSRKQNTSASVSQVQDMPEDLSRTSRAKSSIELKNLNSYTDSGSLPVYIPNCYTPSYVPGNVLWNPNMGIITNGAVPASYPPNTYIINQQNPRKSHCNCDCHVQSIPQVTENPGPYFPVFTIPYTGHLH